MRWMSLPRTGTRSSFVGAQAVYARTQAAGLTVAPFTTDGDLAVDPRTLEDEPDIPERDLVLEPDSDAMRSLS